MKTSILTLMLLALTATATASEDNDTLTIRRPTKVRIISGDSIQKIKVYGREEAPGYTYESSILLVDSNYVSETHINRDWVLGRLRLSNGYPQAKDISMRLGLGLCSAVGADAPVSVATGSSWEISWTIAELVHNYFGRRDGYVIGFGLDWRNYRMTGRHHFVKGDDGTVGTQQYPQGFEPDFSRVKVFSLQVPVMWQHHFAKHWSLSLGPVINFNTHASIKTRYRDAEGRKQKYTAKHLHQQPLTVDIMGWLNVLDEFGIYVKYSPMKVFQTDYADDCNFQSLSFGITL